MTFLNEKHIIIKGITSILFVCLLFMGYVLSQYKVLWNDEIYTQVHGVGQKSYGQIIKGEIKEGNVCPLFYLIQKGLCQLGGYQAPQEWDGEYALAHLRSQILLRIPSNIFMSLAIILIFYFFSVNYSIGWGIYSLLMTLTSYMVWAYWVEARPYSLWFLLTTIQSILFLNFIRFPKERKQLFYFLVAVHLAMSLTVVLSALQVVIVSAIIWHLTDRKSDLSSSNPLAGQKMKYSKYMLLTLLPAFISVYYYFHSPQYGYWFEFPPIQLILQNVPLESLGIIVIYAVFIFFLWRKKTKVFSTIEGYDEGSAYLLLSLLLLFVAFSLLGVFILRDAKGVSGFALSSRYFIFIAPIGIISTVLFLNKLIQGLKDNGWIIFNLVIVMIGLVIIRFLKTFIAIFDKNLY